MVLLCLMLGSGLLAASAWAQTGQVATMDAGAAIALTAAEREWLAANHTVRVRVSDWPPYMLKQPAPSGLSVDYLNAIAKRIGFKVEYVPDAIGWPASMQDVMGARQHYDLILTMHRSPERERQFALTDDYLSMPWVIYTQKDGPFISGLSSLRGKTVAAEKGYVIVEKLKASYPAIRILEVARPEDALRAVAVGQADAYVGNLANATFLIKEYGLTNLVVAAPTAFGKHTHAMAIRKDWPELAALINKGLAAMPVEEQDALRQKWLAVEVRPQTDYTLTWQISGVAMLILLVIFYWNRSLAREIIHRQRVESDLRAEKERAQRYLDTVQTIMVALDRDGCVSMINRAGCALLGFEESELLGRNWFATCLPQPEGMAAVYPVFEQIMAGDLESAEYFENAVRCKDGRERLCAWHNAYFRDANGDIVGTLSSGEDITERKRAETEMFAVQSELAATLDALPDLLFELDLEGCFHDYRASRPELLAVPPEVFLGKTLHDVLPAEAAEECLSALREAHETGRSYGRQIELQVPQGESWFELSVARKPVAAEALPRFIMLSRDITKRKRAEQALRESEGRFHSTLDNMHEGCQIIGFDWRYRYINDAGAAQGRQPREVLLGHSMMEVYPGIEQTPMFAELERCMKQRVTGHLENEFVFPDGSKQWFELSFQPVPEGIFILSIDIAERKRGEAALQTMRAEMEQLMRFHVASQTVSALAHELNQPLNAVTSYAEAALRLLRADKLQPERLLHAVESSAQQAQRAGRVVRELLAFLRQGEVQTEPVDLNNLVRRVLARIDAEGYGGFQTRLQLEPGLAPVTTNRLQLEKVLLNLIENGVEAMRDAGISTRAITITVRTNPEGPMAQVTVRDSGTGIDPQTLHRIFDPFFTTKPKGLGMGLAISRAIIELHGGQLWVESEPGAGASFHFTLPFAS